MHNKWRILRSNRERAYASVLFAQNLNAVCGRNVAPTLRLEDTDTIGWNGHIPPMVSRHSTFKWSESLSQWQSFSGGRHPHLLHFSGFSLWPPPPPSVILMILCLLCCLPTSNGYSLRANRAVSTCVYFLAAITSRDYIDLVCNQNTRYSHPRVSSTCIK